MDQTYNLPRKKAYLWLGVFALVGLALVLLYPDGFQQDSGYHFLFARWGWRHPYMFVGVWSRPLFTFIYGFPALLGFEAARLFSLAIGLATAWQTWKLARDLKLDRSWLVVLLIFLQPSFFILYPDLLTEPMYALVFVIALRLHLRGRVKTGMLVASLMVLTRPEGFFHGILWGVWVLFDKRVSITFWRRIPPTLWLASGGILWWAAAFIVTKDPLFIKHNWPSQWQAGVYGSEPFYAYFLRLPEMVGLVLVIPFLYGLGLLLKRRELGTITSSFLLLFLLHATFRTLGILGDAGYPRYMVCVSPAMAIITLVGWNEIAAKFAHLSARIKLATASVILGISAAACVLYMDGLIWIRDAWAIQEAHQWFQQNPRPVKKLVWSHAYMCIRFDADPTENVIFTPNREDNLKQLRELPSGTLVFWDGQVGPSWNNINDKDFESIGYKRLFSRTYELRGWIWDDVPFKYAGIRPQEMHLLYRE
jgi:hypothetical protein